MAKNTHKVNKKIWTRWGKEGQATFNRLWNRLCPEILPAEWKNPRVRFMNMTQREFNVLRWNVCWTAADMVRDFSESALDSEQ
jgi:hypothetical protein